MEDKQTEIRLMYRELANTLRTKYNPHFNLYQKQQLAEKIKCYQGNQQKPELYYKCIQELDEKMAVNSQSLQKKFSVIELNDKECQDTCIRSFTLDEDKKQGCLLKCMEGMREQCFKLQDQFYEIMLKSNSEYKNIK